MGKIQKFEDLIIWQKGIELSVEIYRVTSKFPKHEVFGLSSQLNRASISIPSNIAEGFGRQSPTEFKRFLKISLGSLLELKTQIIISERLCYLDKNETERIIVIVEEISKITHAILKRY